MPESAGTSKEPYHILPSQQLKTELIIFETQVTANKLFRYLENLQEAKQNHITFYIFKEQ